MKTRSRLLVGAAALAFMVSACGSDDEAAESTPTSTTTEVSATDEPDTETTGETDTESDADETAEAGDDGELFPDIVGVDADQATDGTWSFSVTVSSPYDTPARYADAWRVVGPDGTEYGVRILTHDHQNEQPFTRSLSDVVIPEDVVTVTVQGRDQISGWGGETVTYQLPR